MPYSCWLWDAWVVSLDTLINKRWFTACPSAGGALEKFNRTIFQNWWCDIMMWWRHKGECKTLRGKISKKYLKSLKKHEIKRKFICFVYKIEKYFLREHQLFYFHLWLCHSCKYCIWCSLSEIYFNLTCKTTNILYMTLNVWFQIYLDNTTYYTAMFNVVMGLFSCYARTENCLWKGEKIKRFENFC
jgi:hypothetical protein